MNMNIRAIKDKKGTSYQANIIFLVNRYKKQKSKIFSSRKEAKKYLEKTKNKNTMFEN